MPAERFHLEMLFILYRAGTTRQASRANFDKDSEKGFAATPGPIGCCVCVSLRLRKTHAALHDEESAGVLHRLERRIDSEVQGLPLLGVDRTLQPLDCVG